MARGKSREGGRGARRGGARRSRGAPRLQANVVALRALAHPLRLQIAEVLAEAPRTTKMVAAVLGVPPTRLYHHVSALERAGLVRLREIRPKRGVEEKWYEVTPRRGALRAGGRRRGSGVRVPAALAATLLEQARREVSAALVDPRGQRPFLGRLIAVGSPARIAAIRKGLLGFVRELQRGRERWPALMPAGSPSPERWGLTITFAPVGAGTKE
jgi:DNA-binding transcriptional ArsR family regulator